VSYATAAGCSRDVRPGGVWPPAAPHRRRRKWPAGQGGARSGTFRGESAPRSPRLRPHCRPGSRQLRCCPVKRRLHRFPLTPPALLLAGCSQLVPPFDLRRGRPEAAGALGLVDLQRCILETAQGTKAKKDLEAAFAKGKAQLEKKTKDLQKKVEDLRAKAAMLSKDELGKRQQELMPKDAGAAAARPGAAGGHRHQGGPAHREDLQERRRDREGHRRRGAACSSSSSARRPPSCTPTPSST
jgi:Skp family chaperone for outer membrane proteins